MNQARYFFEAVLLNVLILVFRIMPLDTASATGGWLGRTIGPRLAATRKAKRNLQLAIPELDERQLQEIIKSMWDNLGRVMAEYPHLSEIGKERVKIQDDGGISRLFEKDEPCMMISAHLGNWEIAAAAMLEKFGKELDLTYRAPNNPWVDRLLLKARTLGGKIRCYPKSRTGGQEMMRAMRDRRYIAMLIDQKYNEGIAVPFFGHPAMTNPVFVQISTKFGYPVVPAQIERLNGANFRITLHEPLDTEDKETEEVIAQAHSVIEGWIRKNPEQWLWLHKRWDSQKLEEMKEAA